MNKKKGQTEGEGEPGDSKNDKLSQLRQLLEQKLQKSPTLSCGTGAFKRTSLVLRDGGKPDVASTADGGFYNNTLIDTNNQNLSTRRRVSFNPLIGSCSCLIRHNFFTFSFRLLSLFPISF